MEPTPLRPASLADPSGLPLLPEPPIARGSVLGLFQLELGRSQ